MSDRFDCSVLFIVRKKKRKKDGRQLNKFNPYFLFVKRNIQKVREEMILKYKKHMVYGNDGNPIVSIPMVDQFGCPVINVRTCRQKMWKLQDQLGLTWYNMTREQKEPYCKESKRLRIGYIYTKMIDSTAL
jgi:hypothetical protein